MPNSNLRQLLTDEVRDLYHAEKQLIKALPKMAKAATSDELRQAFESHLEETERQVERLENVFEALGEPVKAKRCPGMEGIVEEGSELMGDDFDGAVLDAGLIAGAQRVEHYEIAAYGSIMAWAKTLGLDEVITLLEPTLEEEKAADEKLSMIAERSINQEAANGATEMDDESAGRRGGSRGRSNGRSTNSRSNGRSARSSGRSNGRKVR
jgi:ferritin-like metal-binding protein YciE